MAPQVGLIGSEQALRAGLGGGIDALNAANQGIDIQAALAGLRGAPAQQQAFQGFQASPGQQFLQQEGEQAILRNASALGGLGGGNVQRALQERGVGLAAQDFGNQFQRGQQVIGSQQALAPTAANLAFGTGQALSSGRLQTGSALSNLLSQQGAGASDIIGGGATNIANLLQGFGGQQAGSNQQLAQLLSNLAIQQGSAAANQPSVAQFLSSGGLLEPLAQLASGVGGAVAGASASDRRLKKNIVKIGSHPNGLNIYKWDWKDIAKVVDGIKMTVGFMADEVEKIMPEAVILDKSGYLKVNYGMVLNG